MSHPITFITNRRQHGNTQWRHNDSSLQIKSVRNKCVLLQSKAEVINYSYNHIIYDCRDLWAAFREVWAKLLWTTAKITNRKQYHFDSKHKPCSQYTWWGGSVWSDTAFCYHFTALDYASYTHGATDRNWWRIQIKLRIVYTWCYWPKLMTYTDKATHRVHIVLRTVTDDVYR